MNEKTIDEVMAEWQLQDDGKVLVGRNGRLFLDNDRNNVIAQHTGKLRLSDRELDRWRRILENRITWLARLGIEYLFVVPPNAHSVYPEDLPAHIETAPQRPANQLVDHLARTESFARLIYPLGEIVGAKPNPLLYPLTDPHWSGEGAFVAYKRTAQEIAQRMQINQLGAGDVNFFRKTSMGELGFKVKPRRQSEIVIGLVKAPQAYLVSDNLIFNRGMRIVTECPDAPNATCLMLGDSFSGQLWNFFAATFRRFVFAHITTLDYNLVERERPNVVVSVLNERFLIVIPDDPGGESASELETKKRAENQFRPRLMNWPMAEPHVRASGGPNR
jgi:alginate O-acetyltransferase complex protein AlgJ